MPLPKERNLLETILVNADGEAFMLLKATETGRVRIRDCLCSWNLGYRDFIAR